MSAPWVWTELDLKRTSDATLIRRAYARRLKIVHPEDDGPGFQRLREAYDQAMAWAAHAPRDVAVEDDSAPPPLEAPAPIRSPEEAGPETQAPRIAELEPSPADPIARLNADIQKLVALLSTLSAPDSQVQAFGEIVANPAMENLGVETQTEAALADLIARTLPRSDALIEPAIARFGWRDDDGARPPSPAVAFILRRRFELAHEARLRKLETSLTTLGATSDATSQALADVLNSPALQDLGLYGRTEAWIAALIARNTPQSDPLIEHVVRRFGWTADRTDVAGIQIVLGRFHALSRVKAPPVRPRLPKLSLRAWYAIAFFAVTILTAVFRHVGQDRIHISPAPPEAVAVGPGRVVTICEVNAQHALSGCRVVSETAPAQHLGPRTLDYLQRRVKLASPNVPVGAQYVATADWDSTPIHDPKLEVVSLQASVAANRAVLDGATPPGPGRVVMSCRVSTRQGLEACAMLSASPKAKAPGMWPEAQRLATQRDGWLTKAPAGTQVKVFADFRANRPASLHAEWTVAKPGRLTTPSPYPNPAQAPSPDLSTLRTPQTIPQVQPFSYVPKAEPDPPAVTPR